MAVRWIKKALGRSDALSIYMGDDVSDEDAFAALRDDITISVGRVSGTCARYHLDLQESVQEFLMWLSGSLGSATAAAHQRA
jgi:trehalose-6-phosphatase